MKSMLISVTVALVAVITLVGFGALAVRGAQADGVIAATDRGVVIVTLTPAKTYTPSLPTPTPGPSPTPTRTLVPSPVPTDFMFYQGMTVAATLDGRAVQVFIVEDLDMLIVIASGGGGMAVVPLHTLNFGVRGTVGEGG